MAGSAEKIDIYREMLKLDPSSRVFEFLAEELCAAGKWKEAERVCREGLRYHPGQMRPRVLLALSLVELGETAEPLGILLDACDEMRKNSIAFKLASDLAAASGDRLNAAEYSRIYGAFHSPDAGSPTETYGAPAQTAPPEQPEAPTEPPGRLELVLLGLAERLESVSGEPGLRQGVFSEADRDMLRKAILSGIGR